VWWYTTIFSALPEAEARVLSTGVQGQPWQHSETPTTNSLPSQRKRKGGKKGRKGKERKKKKRRGGREEEKKIFI
jgi:hypothetical protein